ncbi:MAG: SusC/RagA family TonB-linked outer membrane protein [Petrimonas sp.]|jgi:TonB-linked SusC/RagA family outer membrane protein
MKKSNLWISNLMGKVPVKNSMFAMRIFSVLLLACIFCSTNIQASEKAGTDIVQQQKKQITGTVVDETGLPIIGANVLEIGTTNGTVTDLDGNFNLSVANNAVIRITYIGYDDLDINTAGKTTFNVTMVEDSKALDEVVVIGYGTARKKDLTGSITAVDGSIVSSQSVSTVSRALEGAVAGLQVSSVDGQPGQDMAIRVRGVGSANVNSSAALVVVDGVPAQGDNPLSTINPNDIASITVLKDAASTALYGSRGANGVVLITTKQGKSGKTNISFTAKAGFNSVGPHSLGTIDNAKDFYEFVWKSIYNSYRYGVNKTGQPQDWTTNVNNPNYSHEQAAEFASKHLFNYINSETTFGTNRLGNYMAYYIPGAIYVDETNTSGTPAKTMTGAYLVGTDGRLNPNAVLLYNDTYENMLLKSNFRQEYNISANGGTDKVDYYVSLGYLSDPAYISNSKFDRFSGRSAVNAQMFKWLKVGANVGFSRTTTNKMGTTWGRNPGSNQGNVFRFINGMAPIVPVYAYNEDGSYRTHADGTIYNSTAGSTYSPIGETSAIYGSTNIVFAMENDKWQDQVDILTTRSYAEFTFLNDFKFLVNFSFDKNNLSQLRYANSLTGAAKNVGGIYRRMTNQTIINTQELLTYNKDFDKHHVDALVAHEYNDWTLEAMNWGSSYELIPGFLGSGNFVGRYVNTRGFGGPGYGKDIERMMSYLGRTNYIYDEKYYLSTSLRRDGSSKFKKNRWGTFWSVGGGWRISSEPFMASTDNWLDNLKFRASYGVIGNSAAIGRYSGYRTWGYGAKYTQTTAGTGTPNDYTMSVGGFVNDALTWESTKTFDVGVDFSLFNRVHGTLDYYSRLTDNTYYNQPVNYMAVGQEVLQSNSAALQNNGIEVELSVDIIRKKDFSWTFSTNGTHYTTKLTSVPEGSIPEYTPGLPANTYEANGDGWSASGAGNAAGGQYYLRGVGRDWYNLWIYKYAGVDQETGLPLFYHKVTEEDVKAGTYPGAKVGDDVKVLNYNEASKYEVGSAIPKWIGGFSTTINYKGFDLSAMAAYQLGGYFYSVEYGNGLYRSSYYGRYNLGALSKELINNTWTPENKNAKFPMQWYGADNYDGATFGSWKYTDMALFSASYLRLKNVTLGYTLPSNLISNYGISKLRLFVSADNLFMFSAAKGIDPSMSLTGGMEVGAYTYPAMQTVSFGINLEL